MIDYDNTIVSITANSWNGRLYTFFMLIWAGWVFLVNGNVLIDFSPKPGPDENERKQPDQTQ